MTKMECLKALRKQIEWDANYWKNKMQTSFESNNFQEYGLCLARYHECLTHLDYVDYIISKEK